MNQPTSPFLLPVTALSGRQERERQKVIEHQREEKRILRERVGTKRLRLTNAEERRLAAKGQPLGRRPPGQVATLVTSDTTRRGHRMLIAKKWTYQARGTGRPPMAKKGEARNVTLARCNGDGNRRGTIGLRGTGWTEGVE